MCLLWCLIQLVVLFMYWDLPPPARGRARDAPDGENEKDLVEDEGDEGDEEKPLMASQELAGSYGSVVTSSKRRCDPATSANHVSSDPPLLPDSDEPSGPGKRLCFSRGECEYKRWQNEKKWLTAHSAVDLFIYLFDFAEFLREEVVVLLAGQFITLFNQTALEVQ